MGGDRHRFQNRQETPSPFPPRRVITPPLQLLPPPQLLLSAVSFLSLTLSGNNFGGSSVSQKSAAPSLLFPARVLFCSHFGHWPPCTPPKAHAPEESPDTSPIFSHHRPTSLFSIFRRGPGLEEKEKPAIMELPVRENGEAASWVKDLEQDECFGERPPGSRPRPKGHELDHTS